jgi:hypothetical protein
MHLQVSMLLLASLLLLALWFLLASIFSEVLTTAGTPSVPNILAVAGLS